VVRQPSRAAAESLVKDYGVLGIAFIRDHPPHAIEALDCCSPWSLPDSYFTYRRPLDATFCWHAKLLPNSSLRGA
jgi:hypothetical protein